MNLQNDALKALKETSRTFYIPISRLPDNLREAVASAYLCMRAIDEVEDHPDIENFIKAKILRQMSLNLQAVNEKPGIKDFSADLAPYENILTDVSLQLGKWALLAPNTIAPRIWDATAAMADRMAYWTENNWTIRTEAHLNQYTFSVAGAVGILLSDLWSWHDGTQTSRQYAIGFGRGLQAVNIIRNHREDLNRGVSFIPQGWHIKDVYKYARYNLTLADLYTKSLDSGPALDFCKIPLALAHGTLDVIALGKDKLSRSDVMALVQQVTH